MKAHANHQLHFFFGGEGGQYLLKARALPSCGGLAVWVRVGLAVARKAASANRRRAGGAQAAKTEGSGWA